jgi:hypothetical protein
MSDATIAPVPRPPAISRKTSHNKRRNSAVTSQIEAILQTIPSPAPSCANKHGSTVHHHQLEITPRKGRQRATKRDLRGPATSPKQGPQGAVGRAPAGCATWSSPCQRQNQPRPERDMLPRDEAAARNSSSPPMMSS